MCGTATSRLTVLRLEKPEQTSQSHLACARRQGGQRECGHGKAGRADTVELLDLTNSIDS